MIGVLLALIVLLDYPFRGDVSVSPEPWIELYATMTQDDAPLPQPHRVK
jgi:hypothetical protein